MVEWITSLVSEDGDLDKNTKLLKYLLELGWITPRAHDALMAHIYQLARAERKETPQKIPLTIGGAPHSPLGGPSPRLGGMDGLSPDSKLGMAGGPGMPMPPVPLTSADNMDSLMEVLEWIKYLVDTVGMDNAKDIMEYLVKLGWITGDAHQALLKYIEKSSPVEPKAPKEQEDRKLVMSPGQIPSPEEFMAAEHTQYQVPIQGSNQQEPMAPTPIGREPQHQSSQTPNIQKPPEPFEAIRQPPRKSNEIIPLTELGSDIDSLAIVLEWIRYLVDRAGAQGTKEIFGYYKNIGWVSDAVHDQLIKYVEGIKASEEETVGYQPSVEDHATSLFFISKLKNMELSEADIQSMLGG